MLNELRTLAISLAKGSLQVGKSHSALAPMPKGFTFILRIGTDGLVTKCEERAFDPAADVRLSRIESSNKGVSFPGFNLKGTAIHTKARGFRGSREILRKSLRDFPKQLQGIFSAANGDFRALRDLIKRRADASNDMDAFLTSFWKTADATGQGGGFSKTAKQLLKDLRDESKAEKAKISVFLEIDNPESYPYPVAHLETMNYINEQLLTKMSGRTFAKGGKGSEQRSGRDAYGSDGEIQTRFPQPALPVIGTVTLFSMTKDSPCQYRYGQIESGIFPVAKPTVNAMSDALRYITAPDREGKTWRGVPRLGGGKDRDLLLAYLEDRPNSEATFADFFGESSSAAIADEAFERACENVVRALDGLPTAAVDSSVRIIVLSKADQGRTKVVMSEAYRPEDIRTAAVRWSEGAKNVPPFSVFLPVERGNPAVMVNLRTPFPAEVMRVLNVRWVRDAEDKKRDRAKIAGCSLAAVHALMLRADRAVDSAILSLAIRLFPRSLFSIAGAQHRNQESSICPDARRDALTAVAALGIVLLKFDRRKETYMNASPFQIGRLFSFVDGLHAVYSEVVRKKLPNQLLGNSLIATAFDRPQTALDLLRQRILPYHAWAKTVEGEKAGLARWHLKEIGDIAAALNKEGVPATTSETDRAEMLLGYLARHEKKEESV